MAEKKRKVATSVAAPPAKKSKKSTSSDNLTSEKPEPVEPPMTASTAENAVTKSKVGRKRAADFLGDEPTPASNTAPPAETTKPKKKVKGSVDEPEVAPKKKDNKASSKSNGVKENAKVASETNGTSKSEDPASKGQEEKSNSEDDDDDQGAALLAGFDSDSDDPAEDQGDTSKVQPIPQFKKTSKKLKQAMEKGSDNPGTVYVGRIPHGFYEQQMREYFTQFGTITRLRISRNKRTGASKHFAFIEFESDEVAKIVADTMDNYLMFGHILKCKYAPSEALHPDVWKGANKKYRRIPHDKLERQRLEAPKTQEQWTKKNEKERKKRQVQAEKMKAIGYEYVVPELKDPAEVVKSRIAEEEHGIPAAVKTSEAEPDAIEAPPAVPADEVALKQEKKEKKSKKSKAGGIRESLTQGNLDARDADLAAEKEGEKGTNGSTQTVASTSVATSAPSKKSSKKSSTKQSNSTATEESSHGDYDNLSSIPIGVEAAPASVTDALPSLPRASNQETISTLSGVADAVLAGRKSDRKKEKSSKAAKKQTSKETAAAEVSGKAPGAVGRNAKDKEAKLKGILKKGKK